MIAAAKVIFIGLCSFLNMSSSSDPSLPAASVILHRASMYSHIPFIAFDHNLVKVDPATATNITGSNFDYIPLDGLELTIAEDSGNKPTIDSSFANVARLADYSKATLMTFERTRFPKRNDRPKSGAVAAYLLFGNGSISADWPTAAEYTFKNVNTGLASIGPRQFARRVTYTVSGASATLTIKETQLPDSTATATTLTFTSLTAADVEIWIGNSRIPVDGNNSPDPMTGMKLDLVGYQPATPAAADHFAEFYASLKNGMAGDIYIPIPVLGAGGGSGTGYCGPDSQP